MIAPRGKRRLAVLSAGLLLAGGCSDATKTACQLPVLPEPPPSALVLEVDHNPVRPGSAVYLSVALEEEADALTGLAVVWECWNGERWMITHTLFRGIHGEPSTVEGAVPILAIGYQLPVHDPVRIPDVSPGIYRIRDTAVISYDSESPGQEVDGWVLIWVR